MLKVTNHDIYLESMHELQYESCPLHGKQNELPQHKGERQLHPPKCIQEKKNIYYNMKREGSGDRKQSNIYTYTCHF